MPNGGDSEPMMVIVWVLGSMASFLGCTFVVLFSRFL